MLKVKKASAGAGKTHSITESALDKIVKGELIPNEIIFFTFTKKAGKEFVERLKKRLFETGKFHEGVELENIMAGNLHSVALNLIKKYYYLLGITPDPKLIEDGDSDSLIKEQINASVPIARHDEFYKLVERLNMHEQPSEYGAGVPGWESNVLDIIKNIRHYRITSLTESREISFSAFKAAFQVPDPALPAITIKEVVDAMQALINGGVAKSVLEKFQDQYNNFVNGRWDYHDFYKFGSVPFADKYHDIHPDLKALQLRCRNICKTSGMLEDVASFYELIFEIAETANISYSRFKVENGYIDFTDMEEYLLKLLDIKDFQNDIRSQVKLLIVDEFQDSNPMQIAIYTKLMSICPDIETIWVGDTKQSIFSVQGADYSLFANIVKKAEQDGTLDDPLTESFRTREKLIEITNKMFTGVFDGFDPMDFHRDENHESVIDLDSEAWIHLHADGLNYADVVAEEISKIIGSRVIYDKSTEGFREVTGKDIAILVSFNDSIPVLSDALAKYNIKSASDVALYNTAEGRFLVAAIKFLVHNSTLALAELGILSGEFSSTVNMMEDRIEYLSTAERVVKNGVSYVKEDKWMKNRGEVINRLTLIRDEVMRLPLCEAIETILLEGGLYDQVLKLDSPNQRLTNIQNFRYLAEKYITYADKYKVAKTLLGFIIWFDETRSISANDGIQPDPDAVNILTYYKSKGLEWPVVICTELHHVSSSHKYQVRPVAPDTFDQNDPLRDYKTLFFFWPFGLSGDDNIINAFRTTSTYIDKHKETIAEKKRILYVGLTRARDYMYTVSDKTPLTWWQNTFAMNDFSELLNEEGSESKFRKGIFKGIPMNLKKIKELKRTGSGTPQPDEVFVPAGRGTRSFIPATINPSSLIGTEKLKTGFKLIDIPGAIKLNIANSKKDDDWWTNAGTCLHYILELDSVSVEQAQSILKRYGIENDFSAEEVLKNKAAFEAYITSKHPSAKIDKEIPIKWVNEHGQLINGIIDQLVSEKSSTTVYDHKTYPVLEKEELTKKIESLAPQMIAYKKILHRAHGEKHMVNCMIHFVSLGKIAELSI